MNKSIFVLMVSAASMFVSCSNDSNGLDNQSPAEPIRLNATEIAACEASNDFGLDLLTTELSKHDEGENVILSPFSASTALALFSAASDDNFASELATILEVDKDALNSYVKTVSDRLLTLDKKTELAIANGVWYEQSEQLKSEFQDIVAKYYSGSCFAVPFFTDPDGSREIIQNWISKNTKGLIKDMDFHVSSLTKIVVGNAIYFKGQWQEAFKKSDSKPATFHSVGGDSNITMMHHDFESGLYRGDNYIKVGLPFGNGAFIAYFVLPDEGTTPFELLESNSLTTSTLPLSQSFAYSLSLPRFKLDNLKDVKLTETLAKMGLKSLAENAITAFEGHDVGISADVLQKCFLEVNESGAEAAAVTIITGDTSSLPPHRVDVVFDRPFLVFICESSTNTMLFAGRVSEL